MVFAALYAAPPMVQSSLLRMVIYEALTSKLARPLLPDIILWLKQEPVEPQATSSAERVFESDREDMNNNIQSFCKSESIAWDTALGLSRCIEQTRNKRL